MSEIEIKFLDIDPAKLEKKLLAIGAKKISDELLEEWIFKKDEWSSFHGRVRIRRTGKKTELAYKETRQKSSDGNVEIEFSIDNAEQGTAFMRKIGVPQVRHQQKRRIHYLYNAVAIDIDFWPKIPPLVEIEGENKQSLEKVAALLGFSMDDVCELDARQVIKDIYHVDVDVLEEYVF